jgi:hypothetical protein
MSRAYRHDYDEEFDLIDTADEENNPDDYDFDQDELMHPIHNEDGSYDLESHTLIDGVGFADPGGRSALRAATPTNPRNLPCPTCGRENVLTPLDKAHGYQCDACADAAEGF